MHEYGCNWNQQISNIHNNDLSKVVVADSQTTFNNFNCEYLTNPVTSCTVDLTLNLQVLSATEPAASNIINQRTTLMEVLYAKKLQIYMTRKCFLNACYKSIDQNIISQS